MAKAFSLASWNIVEHRGTSGHRQAAPSHSLLLTALGVDPRRIGASVSRLGRGYWASMPADSTLLETVRRTRRELVEQGPRDVRADGDFGRVSIPESDGDALRDLLLDENARVLIEIGLAYGSSALAIAEALSPRGRREPST